MRLGPEDDATAVTAARLRGVVARITAAGRWKDGDPDIAVFLDSGYDLTRLAWLLGDLPLEACGRLRCDRVMYRPAPPREEESSACRRIRVPAGRRCDRDERGTG